MALKFILTFPVKQCEFSALLNQEQSEWEWLQPLWVSEWRVTAFLCKGYVIFMCSMSLWEVKPFTCSWCCLAVHGLCCWHSSCVTQHCTMQVWRTCLLWFFTGRNEVSLIPFAQQRDQVTRGVISTSLAWSSLLMKPASVLCILVFLEYSKSRCFQGDHGQWPLLASAQTHYVPVHQEMCVSREEPRELHFVIPISLYMLKGKEIITTHLITCRAVC